MRYLSIGYNTICLSPLLSLFLIFFVSGFVARQYGGCFAISANSLVVSFQVCGIVLYFAGYLWKEYMGMELYRKHPFIQLAGIVLIIWGVLIMLYVDLQWSLYEQHLRQMSLYFPEQTITLQQTIQYVIYLLKGMMWIASGLALMVTSFIQTKTLFPTYPD